MSNFSYDSTSGKMTAGEKEVSPIEFFDAAGRIGHFETGILPFGLISIRSSGGITQIAVQTHPRIHTFAWGKAEKSTPVYYELAMPWRVIFGTFSAEGNLVGARLFHSPNQIYSENDNLYLPNVPNTNIRGYGIDYISGSSGQNAIGWVCIYNDGSTHKSVADKMRFLIEIVSGANPYNDNNMKSTDGTRFYQEKFPNKPYLWNPIEWQAKTKTDGVSWVCDPENMIPAKVSGLNAQNCYVEDGIPLTFAMASTGDTLWHYSESRTTRTKPYNCHSEPKDEDYGLLSKVKAFFSSLNSPVSFDYESHDINWNKLNQLPVIQMTKQNTGINECENIVEHEVVDCDNSYDNDYHDDDCDCDDCHDDCDCDDCSLFDFETSAH